MPPSLSQRVDAQCPECGTPFAIEFWLIVDAGERPDLAARCRDGSIFTATCPNGHTFTFGAPLLYHDRAREQLILALPPGVDEQQAREIHTQLLARLQANLLAPFPAYLNQTQVVPQPLLPAALADDPNALAEQLARAMPPLLRALYEFIAADSWDASERTLRAHPELLSDDADQLLAQLIDAAREQKDADAEKILMEHRELLQRARRSANRGQRSEVSNQLAALQALSKARSPQELLHTLRVHPILLNDETLEQIRGIIANARAQGDEGMARHLEERLQTIEEFKASGATLDDLARMERAAVGAGNIPAELHPLWQEITRLTRRSEMPRKIELCEQALRLVRREDSPTLWAGLQGELANALNQTPRGSRADNLERAIRHYELALQVYTREAFPEQWATTQNNLATAYSDRIRGERAENLEEAIRHYELALQVLTREAFPGEHRRTARNLGDAFVAQGDWLAARKAYAQAIQTAEQLFRSAVDPTTQRAEAAELADLYDRDINACVVLDDQRRRTKDERHLDERRRTKDEGLSSSVLRPPSSDALTSAEAARSRAFLKQMGLGDYPAPATIPPALLQHERDLVAKLRDIEVELASTPTRADRATERERALVAQHRALVQQWDEVLDAMLQQGGDAARDYVALRRGETPTWEDLRALATRIGPHAALVEFHNLADKIVALIWRDGWDAPQLVAIPLDQQNLLHRYLWSYATEVLDYELYERYKKANRLYHEWLNLGEILLAPLVERRPDGTSLLGDASLVYFIPHGYLHLLPLHALTVRGQPFIEERAVAYAPSAAVLGRALEDERRRTKDESHSSFDLRPSSFLVMGYALREEERPTFIGEAVEVATMFGVEYRRVGDTSLLVDDAATRAALMQHAPRSKLIHLSCHGLFRADDPLASAVLLADGEFTAREWMGLRLDADLVTLSACQLAFSDVNPGDDLVGMTRALFYAGASSVLLALWSVQSDTTMKWMRDFYARVQGGEAKASAHREATRALYESHKDEPYIWAPFVLVG